MQQQSRPDTFPTTSASSADVTYGDATSIAPTAVVIAIPADDESVPHSITSSVDLPEHKVEVAATPDNETIDVPCVGPVPLSRIRLSLRYQATAFLLAFLIAMLGLCMVLTITTWRYPNPASNPQLPDIALDNLPDIPILEHVTDGLIGVLATMCFAVIFAVWLIAHGHINPRDRVAFDKLFPAEHASSAHLVPWVRFFVCYTAITLIRIVVLACTVLPATNNQCQVRPHTGNFLWNAVVGLLTFGAKNVHCGDLLFSGHTSVITLCVCSIWTYGHLVHRMLRPVAVSLMIFSWFTILLSRSHYTDDIIIAIYIAVTLWILTPHSHFGAPTVWQMVVQVPWRWCSHRGQ